MFPIVAVTLPGTIDNGLNGAAAPVTAGGLTAPKPVKYPAIQPPAAAMHLQPPHPKIEMPPHRVLRSDVLPRSRREAALRTDQTPAAKRHLNHHPKWRMGVMRSETEDLLRAFFARHRTE